MNKSIFICGYSLHGKSTLANIINDGNIKMLKYKIYTYGTENIHLDLNTKVMSFANVLKNDLCTKLSIDRKELERNKENYRKMLIEDAKEKRSTNADYFVDKLIDEYYENYQNKRLVVDDWRYINELYRGTEKKIIINTIRVFDKDKPIPPKEREEEHQLDGVITDYVCLMKDTKLEDLLKQFPQYSHWTWKQTKISWTSVEK